MTMSLLNRARVCVSLLGLAAVFSLCTFTEDAEAVRKKQANVRGPIKGKLKPPPKGKARPATSGVFANLQAVGIIAEDVPGRGCVIRAVTANSPADKGGLQPGDVLVSIEDISVSNTADADFVMGEVLQLNFREALVGVIDVNSGNVVGVILPLSNLSGAARPAAKAKAKS